MESFTLLAHQKKIFLLKRLQVFIFYGLLENTEFEPINIIFMESGRCIARILSDESDFSGDGYNDPGY